MKVFAAHNADEQIRRESSAGGVFSIIATKIIEDGGVVYSAAFDDQWNVVHRRVDNIADLAMLRGSKYVYSKFAPAISDAINDLNDGRRVLFSGTPCQVAAMKAKGGQAPNLLLVEVVCHGVPEAKYWTKYLKEICKQTEHTVKDIISINFRDKRTGWKEYSYTILFSDGTSFSQKHPDNLYFRAFIKNYTLREACFRCPFKFPNNKGDIILGDFWGAQKIAPDIDDDLGLTICLTATDKGETALSNLKFDKDFDLDSIILSNKSLTEQAKRPTDYRGFTEFVDNNSSVIKAFKKYAALSWRTKLNIKIASLIRELKC